MKHSAFFKMMSIAWLCLLAGAANATTAGLTFTQSSTTPYVWTATFGNSVSNSFADTFTFTNPVTPQTGLSGGATNIGSLGINGTNVIFSLFQLFDVTSNTILASGGTGGNTSAFNFSLPNFSDSYELLVNGNTTPSNTTGSYAGNIAVSAVPEPKTYAMLVAGLGLVAFTARRRKGSSFF